MSNPVQIILNPDQHFIAMRETGGGSRHKDFYVNNDSQFIEHKNNLLKSIADIAEQIEKSPFGKIGYVKITLTQNALAKSHRPFTALFKSNLCPCIGNGDLGELYVKVTPRSLLRVSHTISKEAETKLEIDDDGPKPSRARSEVGAIQSIGLYDAYEKRDFSVEESIERLSQSCVIGGFNIELFEDFPKTLDENGDEETETQKLFKSLLSGLNEFSSIFGQAQHLDKYPSEIPEMLLPLSLETLPSVSEYDLQEGSSPLQKSLADFLDFIGRHPLIRRIILPIRISSQLPKSSDAISEEFVVPDKNQNTAYPKMGIIDGGISPSLGSWVIGSHDHIASVDQQLDHGTFIAGLCCFGRQLNTDQICAEPDGIEIFDISILPRDTAYKEYYPTPTGLDGFLDELEQGIKAAIETHNIRIFNLSINTDDEVSMSRCSAFAARLDLISDKYACLIFISGGNLTSFRTEWESDVTVNLRTLATSSGDRISIPSESLRNVSITALNPPGLPSPNIPFGFASYSRRGPGSHSGNKPDFAHVGGGGVNFPKFGSGLKSITPSLLTTTDRGTSYAAPIVARTAAQLDYEIADDLAIETIKAMLIHNSKLPPALSHRSYNGLNRELAGYGIPRSAEQILQSGDHEITMVFEAILKKDRALQFDFPWPVGLTEGGKCRGEVKLTVVAKPPVDTKFGAELVRVNIDASLQQEDGLTSAGNVQWRGRIKPKYLREDKNDKIREKNLIKHCQKWNTAKVFGRRLTGVGKSSNWRLQIDYLTRSNFDMPEEGIPISVVLSIADADETHDVFNQMRLQLGTQGIELQDIQVTTQVQVSG